MQLAAASELKMPLMQSCGLVANPGVAEVRIVCDGDPVHGRLKSGVLMLIVEVASSLYQPP